MTFALRAATRDDSERLAHLFADVFTDTFGDLYDPADLALFLSEHRAPHWAQQLGDPAFAVCLAEADGAAAGYAKLGPLRLPVEPPVPAIELRQLYVGKHWRGAGIAPALMDWTLAEARERGAGELYLSVYTRNSRARRFYRRYGFEEVGPYQFMVGGQADEDIIMRLAL